MRKHFLLLFLMTLIPFYGWAEDLTGNPGVIVAVADIEYGQAAFGANDIRVTLDGGEITNTYWDVAGYYVDQACTEEVASLAALPFGATRYVKINFVGAYSGYAVGSFAVKKATIVVNIKAADAHADFFTKSYMGTEPEALTAADVIGTLRNADITEADYLNIDVTKLNQYTYNKEGSVAGSPYAITFPADAITLIDADNYELDIKDRSMKITAAPITTGEGTKFTFESNYTAAYTYNAAEQKPTYTITWNHDGDAETAPITLTEGTDFTLVYNDGGADVANPTNAANYTVKLNGVTGGNFSATNLAVADFNFSIAQAPMTIMALPKTKPYDGEPYAVGQAQFNISGRVGADAQKAVTGLVATEEDPFFAGVASYTVGVNTAGATIGGVALGKNYAITVTPVEWAITKATLTVTANDVTMVKGDDYPALNAVTDPVTVWFTVEGAVNAAEEDIIKSKYEVAYANADGEPLNGIAYTALQVQTYEDAIKLTQTANAVFDNYEVTEEKADLIVNGAPFTIMPVVASDIEYGDKYEIAYYTTGEIDADQLVFVIGETEYAWKDRKTWALPTTRDTYTVTIKNGTAVGKGASQGGVATPLSTSYNIIKKQLHLTVKPQTMHKGDPIALLATLTAGADGCTITEDLAYNDEIADLGLTYSLDADLVTIADRKINAAAGDIANAILVEIGNENYEFAGGAYTKGKLTVSTTYTADLNKDDAIETITNAAANGNKYDVTLTDAGFVLPKDKWSSLVLPFAIDPLKFCEEVGTYAVFNYLKSAENGNVKFALTYKELPANTPFLVKPQKDINFMQETIPGTRDIVFHEVTFSTTNFDAEKKTATAPVDDADFIGVYDQTTVDGAAGIYIPQNGKFYEVTEGTPTLYFMAAYLKVNSTNPARITVEEADGSTTAISAITADGQLIPAEGWYTLNGVKLQAAPVEKGVYINNGKKVVIK